jgi:hypothetical protein
MKDKKRKQEELERIFIGERIEKEIKKQYNTLLIFPWARIM